jgi:hypothetical protein
MRFSDVRRFGGDDSLDSTVSDVPSLSLSSSSNTGSSSSPMGTYDSNGNWVPTGSTSPTGLSSTQQSLLGMDSQLSNPVTAFESDASGGGNLGAGGGALFDPGASSPSSGSSSSSSTGSGFLSSLLGGGSAGSIFGPTPIAKQSINYTPIILGVLGLGLFAFYFSQTRKS